MAGYYSIVHIDLTLSLSIYPLVDTLILYLVIMNSAVIGIWYIPLDLYPAV